MKKENIINSTPINPSFDHRQLGCAIAYNAVKEFCKSYTSKAQKNKILKDLRSEYLVQFSGGHSLVAADKLEINPKEIAERVRRDKEEL